MLRTPSMRSEVLMKSLAAPPGRGDSCLTWFSNGVGVLASAGVFGVRASPVGGRRDGLAACWKETCRGWSLCGASLVISSSKLVLRPRPFDRELGRGARGGVASAEGFTAGVGARAEPSEPESSPEEPFAEAPAEVEADSGSEASSDSLAFFSLTGRAFFSRSAMRARNSEAMPGSPQVERPVAGQCQNSTCVSGSRCGPCQTLRARPASSRSFSCFRVSASATSWAAVGFCLQWSISLPSSAKRSSSGEASEVARVSMSMYLSIPLPASEAVQPGGSGQRRRQFASQTSSG
mmetsp:Transcript_60169/g.130498  ORF Transcript_60169/g.130498 Transcript_60169/m.130498 type:complete len:292 (+) Transcript_60169:381-1256(+)